MEDRDRATLSMLPAFQTFVDAVEAAREAAIKDLTKRTDGDASLAQVQRRVGVIEGFQKILDLAKPPPARSTP